MTLAPALTPFTPYRTGNLKWVCRTPASLSGLVEFEPGWILLNGLLLSAGLVAPSGRSCDALRAEVGTSFGALGQLPDMRDGRQAFARGVGQFSLGGAGGVPTHVLTLAQIPDHTHPYNDFIYTGANYTSEYDQWNDGFLGEGLSRNSGAAGSGSAHDNMPPHQVVGGCLVKL